MLMMGLISAVSSSSLDKKAKEDELQFVFELVRHGARTAMREKFCEGFEVYDQNLTASGMRQRYLLGRYARQRYMEDLKFLSPNYKPGEVQIISTDVGRTL